MTETVRANGTRPGLYELVGGPDALKLAVDRFYEAVLADPDLAPYFDGADVSRIKRHQVLLLSQVLGGPSTQEVADLREAHARLHVTGRHYDLVGAHLMDTLTELGVHQDVLDGVEGVLTAVRDDIVTVVTDQGS